MRRIVARGGKPSLIDIDAPACASGRVLVKTEFSTVSAGTESSVIARSAVPDAIDVEYPGEPPYKRPPIRHWMRNSPEPTPPLPGSFSLGYSLAGRVIEVGSDVDDIVVGDMVACAGSQDAHHADVVAVSRNLTAPVPAGLDLQTAAFVTPGAVGMEAVRRTNCRFGESVVIFGLGLIGLMAAQVARVAGLTVIGLEPSPERREAARSHGINDVFDPGAPDITDRVMERTDGFGADSAVLTLVSSSSEPVNQALRLTRRGGRVVGVGVFGMNLDRGSVFDRTYVHAIAFGAGRYDRGTRRATSTTRSSMRDGQRTARWLISSSSSPRRKSRSRGWQRHFLLSRPRLRTNVSAQRIGRSPSNFAISETSVDV